jgi:hypothetical protein
MNDIIEIFRWSTLKFDHPELFFWMIPAAILTGIAAYFWWRWRRRDIEQYGTLELVTRWTAMPTWRMGALMIGTLVSAVVFGFITATMPYQPISAYGVPAGSLRVEVWIDASRSMGVEDYRKNQQVFGGTSCSYVEGPCGRRIDVARLVVLKQLMPALKGNQLALGIYARGFVRRSFLTNEFEPLTEMLTEGKWVDVGSGLGEGSFVDQSLLGAVHGFDVADARDPSQKAANANEIVLITDGGNDSDDEAIEKAVEAVKKAHARLIVVLVGSPQEGPIPEYDLQGKPTYNKDGSRHYFTKNNGEVAQSARDEAIGERLHDQVGAEVIKLTPGQDLGINWAQSLGGSRTVVGKHYLYRVPLAICMVILAGLWLGPLWGYLLGYGRRQTGGSRPPASTTADKQR